MSLLRGLKPEPQRQVGALCCDRKTGQVLLITSRGTGRWIIPKGWPVPDLGRPGSALQEAWEEAGVRGEVVSQIGRYDYDKLLDNGGSVLVRVQVFLALVDGLADDFPEAGQRHRRWFQPAKAAGLVDEKGLRKILRDLPGRK